MSDLQPKVEDLSFIDRLKVEQEELVGRAAKLEVFIGSERFNQLPSVEQADQRLQLLQMNRLADTLTRRLRRLLASN